MNSAVIRENLVRYLVLCMCLEANMLIVKWVMSGGLDYLPCISGLICF